MVSSRGGSVVGVAAIDPPTWEEVRELEKKNRRLSQKVDELEERMNPREFVMNKLLEEEKHLPNEVRMAILDCLPGDPNPTAVGVIVPL